ncbi:MAG TPA: glycosyltransferase family 2 protein [Luteibaculaceae bacterium]|nr:glycosyltransferase family 2 protein [Luteibaculaceae bacterium]
MKISAVIITYNEERNIKRCLDSLTGVADEIVVLDSFSTDQTQAICQTFPTTFIQHPFEGYIEQKNRAVAHAQFDWVLSLDADEALSDAARLQIAHLKSLQEHPTAYGFNRLTNYCGKWIKHCGWYPDRKIRLFNRLTAHWAGVNPHDIIVFNTPQPELCYLPADLLHYSYYTIEEHIQQTHRFTTIAARALHEKGKKASIIKRFGSPIFKFLKDYFLRLGFLDGYFGWKICWISAHATYLKYQKLDALGKQSR